MLKQLWQLDPEWRRIQRPTKPLLMYWVLVEKLSLTMPASRNRMP